MQKLKITKFLYIISGLLTLYIIFLPKFAYCLTWQQNLENYFDIVETFDELQDWAGRPLNGRDTNKDYLPKRLDGSDSMWDFYDYWSSNPSSEPTWIGNHGVDSVRGGTGKSLRMHVGGTTKKGPSRFGLYFGTPNGGPPDAYSTSGSADSGYDEVYVFYMLKYHSNAFPKKSNGDYDYFGYYKFNVLASGFLSIGNPASGTETYGPSNGHPHLSMCSSYCGSNALNSISIKQRYVISGTGSSDNYYWTQDGSFNSYLENSEWFGVEFYYSRGTPGQNDGKMKIWLYDEQGNEKQVLDVTQNMMPAGANYKYNKFFFGGNLSFNDKVATQGLDTDYFVDDFIIDGNRIGPSYFALNPDGTIPPDSTPPIISSSSPSGIIPSGTTSIDLQLNTNESAICRYSTSPGVDYSLMVNTFSTTGATSHSTSITGLQDGQTYSYYVRSQDSAGNTNTDDYLISFSVALPDYQAPSKPSNLISQAISSTQINLTWDASSDNIGVTGYKIYRDDVQISTTSSTSFQDTGLSDSTTYSYTVSAYDAAGNESGQSDQGSDTTLADITPPSITNISTVSPTQVIVVFSEPIDIVSSTIVSNYGIDNGIIVFSATLDSGLRTVTLTTSPHVEGTYILTVNSIQDLASIPNTITANTQGTYDLVTQIVISNLTVASGKTYEVVENLGQNEMLVYTDRAYIYTEVPSLLDGGTYIKTANNDKNLNGTSFLTFDVNQDVTIYVAFDDRITTKPSWLSSFSDTGDNLLTSDTILSIFAHDYSAGNITLGGNEAGYSMYTVIIKGQGDGSAIDSTPPSPPTGLRIIL